MTLTRFLNLEPRPWWINVRGRAPLDFLPATQCQFEHAVAKAISLVLRLDRKTRKQHGIKIAACANRRA